MYGTRPRCVGLDDVAVRPAHHPLDTALTAVEDSVREVNASRATVVRDAGFISPRSTITDERLGLERTHLAGQSPALQGDAETTTVPGRPAGLDQQLPPALLAGQRGGPVRSRNEGVAPGWVTSELLTRRAARALNPHEAAAVAGRCGPTVKAGEPVVQGRSVAGAHFMV